MGECDGLKNNIDRDAHYFILTRPMDFIPILGMYIGKTYGPNMPEVWAEFEVVEEYYKIDDGYKIELRAIDPIYGKETFYQSDFQRMLESGKNIIKKTSNKQHVEEMIWMEPLWENVRTVHTASVLVND